MKRVFVVILILSFILASCSGSTGGARLSGLFGGGSSSNDVIKEDNTGNGLKVNLNINQEFIDLRRVDYELTIENTGKEPIIIEKRKFQFTTLQKVSNDIGDSNGVSVFEDSSLNLFYSKVFGDKDSITIYQNQEIETKGSLMIKTDFFNELNQESFDYVLKVLYDYKTEFSNSVLVDLKNIDIKVKGLSQAAPVQITKLELKPVVNEFQEGGEAYVVNYYVRNSGNLGNSKERVAEITDYEIIFSNSDASCDILKRKDGKLVRDEGDRLQLDSKTSELIFSCLIDTSSLSPDVETDTITSGYLEYQYYGEVSGKITLPKKSSDLLVA